MEILVLGSKVIFILILFIILLEIGPAILELIIYIIESLKNK